MNRLSFLSILFLLNGVFGADTLFIIADIANVRKKPEPDASIIAKLNINTPIVVKESKGDWIKLSGIKLMNGKTIKLDGWIHKSLSDKNALTVSFIEQQIHSSKEEQEKEKWLSRFMAIAPQEGYVFELKEKVEKFTANMSDTGKQKWISVLNDKQPIYVAYRSSGNIETDYQDGKLSYRRPVPPAYLLGFIDTTGVFHSTFTPVFNDEPEGVPDDFDEISNENSQERADRFRKFVNSIRLKISGLQWYMANNSSCISGTAFIPKLNNQGLIEMGPPPECLPEEKETFYFSSPVSIAITPGLEDLNRIKPVLTDSIRKNARCRYHYDDAGWEKPMTIRSVSSYNIGETGFLHLAVNWYDNGNGGNALSHFVLDNKNVIRWHLHGMGSYHATPWFIHKQGGDTLYFTLTESFNTTCGCTCGHDQIGFISVYQKQLRTNAIST